MSKNKNKFKKTKHAMRSIIILAFTATMVLTSIIGSSYMFFSDANQKQQQEQIPEGMMDNMPENGGV